TGGSFTRGDLSVGVHTITAAATDTAGLTGSRSFSLEVKAAAAPTIALTAPVGTRPWALGAPVPFAASASDAFDGTLTSSIHWRSSRDGALGTGTGFTRSNLTAGTHTLTASVTNSAGLAAAASTDVTVIPATPPTVT